MSTIVPPPGNTYSTSATGGTGYPGDAATGHGVRSIVKTIEAMDPREHEFYNSLKKLDAKNIRKTEWVTKATMPTSVTLAEAVDTSETAIDLASGHGNRLQKGHILWVPEDASGNAEEIWRVTDDADSTDTRDVARAQAGTSAVAHDTGTVVRLIGVAMGENSDHPFSQYIFGDLAYSFPQRFAKKIQMDKRAVVQPTIEFAGNQFEMRLKEKAQEAIWDVEQAFLLGRRAEGDGTTTNPSMTMGLRQSCILSGNDYDLTDGLLNVYDIEEAFFDLWTNVGPKRGTRVLASMTTARIWDTLLNPRREFGGDTTSVNLQFKTAKTRVGDIEIMVNRWIPDGEIYIYNPEMVGYFPFEGLDWHFARKQAGVDTDGDYVVGSISADFTFVNFGIETCAIIRGFDTNIENYPIDIAA